MNGYLTNVHHVVEQWLKFPIQVDIYRPNWIHRIVYSKKVFKLLVPSCSACTKWLVAGIITICWVTQLRIKIIINRVNRGQPIWYVDNNVLHCLLNRKRLEVWVLCTTFYIMVYVWIIAGVGGKVCNWYYLWYIFPYIALRYKNIVPFIWMGVRSDPTLLQELNVCGWY